MLSYSAAAPDHPMPLILASTSTYRRDLLNRLGLVFEVCSPGVDETPLAGERPADLAMRLALAKAQAVAGQHPGAVVIGSDQVADLHGEPLGKPGNHANAVAQLRRQSGQAVVFQTAVAVVCLKRQFAKTALASVQVQFRPLRDAEPAYDCAGSAKSEGLGIALLERIDSDDPTSLIGLPLMRTCALLRELGIRVPA